MMVMFSIKWDFTEAHCCCEGTKYSGQDYFDFKIWYRFESRNTCNFKIIDSTKHTWKSDNVFSAILTLSSHQPTTSNSWKPHAFGYLHHQHHCKKEGSWFCQKRFILSIIMSNPRLLTACDVANWNPSYYRWLCAIFCQLTGVAKTFDMRVRVRDFHEIDL